MRIGIPRALTYHDYFPLWETFFSNLGCTVIVTPPTTPDIANQGLKLAGDDVCYPVKLMHGHVAELVGKVDAIFVPRLFSVQAETCECPKLIGLADMLRHSIPQLPPLVSPYINLRLGKRGLLRAIYASGRQITRNPMRLQRAFQAGMHSLAMLRAEYTAGRLLGRDQKRGAGANTLAVIGHPYNLYDNYANLRIIERLLQQDFRVLTPQMLSDAAIASGNAQLRKQLFWSSGRTVFGAGAHFATNSDVSGIIHLASFGCGLESLIIDLVQRVAIANNKPFLLVTLDEHTGEAGMETRLEAFIDMLTWKEAAFCV